MDRRHEVTKFISREQVGIEIAPYFAGLAPKRDGYQCLVLDVFDTKVKPADLMAWRNTNLLTVQKILATEVPYISLWDFIPPVSSKASPIRMTFEDDRLILWGDPANHR